MAGQGPGKAVKVPVGRAARLLRFTGAGTRTAAALLSSRTSDAAAVAIAQKLGTLRGLAAKVGQMAGYVDGFIPEAHRAAFESAMASLQAGAPESAPEDIRILVEAELGASIGKLFAEWHDSPIASASIGQVHRARLFDGREVAVKVQHPGIDEAVRSDLSNAAVVRALVNLVSPSALDARAIFQYVEQRILEELDYAREAEHQRFFAALHRGDPRIWVPAVIGERSSRRVLTSELASGDTLEIATRAAPELRRGYAETLWRFVFKNLLVAGQFNADPHPGNYLFEHDGRVVFLDFGLVQALPPELLTRARAMHRAALERNENEFRAAARTFFGTRGGSYQEFVDGFARGAFEPLFASPFHLTRSYVADLVRSIYEMKQQILFRDRSFPGFPPEMVFVNRLQFGFFSVLARLDVPADYAAVEKALLREMR